MKEEIIYYLKLLHFLQKQTLTEDELNKLIQYIELNDIDTNISDIHLNVIEEVQDSIISLVLIRDVKHINIDNNCIIYNKKKFPFNNIYGNDQYNNLILQSKNFIQKRCNVNKDSTLILFGYSSSGKSTLCDHILSNFSDQKTFRLYEVYLNKYYVYYNGLKSETKTVDEDKYIFKTNNIKNVMLNFSRKRPNGVNNTSSRSHVILELIFEGCIVRLIDLCGNEKATGQKELLAETNFINTSLFNLSRYLTIGNNFKQNNCKLLDVVRKSNNIIFTLLMNDNANNLAVNHLLMLKSFLKTLAKAAPLVVETVQTINDIIQI